jgi:hypothetical protein
LIINPTDKILLQLLSFLESDEGIRITYKSNWKKIFINKNLLGNYVLLLSYKPLKSMHILSNSRIFHEEGRNCSSDEIVYLNNISEVLELIHSEFGDIAVSEY